MDDGQFMKSAYRALTQREAADARQDQYYVPIYEQPGLRDHDVARQMKRRIELSIDESTQVLSGFKGSGKSSELRRLRNELTRGGYAVVFMDAEDYFNTQLPIDIATVPIMLAAGFLDNAPDGTHHEALWGRLLGFLKCINVEPSVGFEVSPDIPGVPGGSAHLSLKVALQEDTQFITAVKQAMKESRLQVRQQIHAFFADCATELKKTNPNGVVFIVDSLDHFRGRAEKFQQVRESMEQMFSELAVELRLPGIHAIYTTPIYVETSAFEVRRDVLNIKVQNRSGTPNEEGIAALTSLLRKRCPDNDLERLLGDETREVILKSGGLIRDLLRLLSEAIIETEGLPISARTWAQTEQTLRNAMSTPLSLEQYEILRQVDRSQELIPAHDQWPDVTYLMSLGAILKYPNGNCWFQVHPLLREVLG